MGKKINELNTATEVNNGTLLFVGNPSNGSLKKISLQSLSKYVNCDKLEPGTTSYYVEADTIIKGFWFQGGSESDISVGNDEGLDDLVESGHLPENDDLVFEVFLKFRNPQWIYFTGMQEDTVVIIYKL